MYLKSLELAGFKSFAKKTELQFNTPITAIVGPNGSGKSNIAEAFRFVLGEQSIKSMRGKRTEDLIWNGSPDMGRSNRASVKLTFDNRQKLLNLDFEEVSLERVIYRDASSEYLLNNSPVRLRDIIEILASAHIGSSGHHIISQGEADRILNANMKERREIIEDALGLKIFQWKREESERKLEKTEENMAQVSNLRKEIAPHLAFLKKQVEKIERTKALKIDLRDLYAEYLALEHAFIRDSKKQIAEEEQGPRDELSLLEEELSAQRRAIEKTRGVDERARAVIEIGEKINFLRKTREEINREIGRIEGEIAGAERIAKTIQPQAESLIPLSEILNIHKEIDSALKEKEEGLLRSIVEKIRDSIRAIIEKHGKREERPSNLENEIAEFHKKKSALESKLREIQNDEKKASEEERRVRSDIEKEKDSSRDAEKEIFRIMARQNELHGKIGASRAKLHEIEHLETDLKRELTEGALLVGREILEFKKDETNSERDRALQEERRRKIERLKIRIEEAGAGGGADILKEFEEASERDRFFEKELSDLELSSNSLRSLISELEEKIELEFNSGILKINEEFTKFFALMFGGGSAKLSIIKSDRKKKKSSESIMDDLEGGSEDEPPLEKEEETGIDIEVNLPRKKIKGLVMLSGGERALTSIALLFAMSQVKPPPFIILDETDAALDEANSKKYGDMIENLSKFSQLILITHNRETMSRAGIIYGVTMDRSGVSKLLSIAFDQAVEVAK